MLAAVGLSGLARRVGAPYPVFLAVDGANEFVRTLLAEAEVVDSSRCWRATPSFTVPPELALALFIGSSFGWPAGAVVANGLSPAAVGPVFLLGVAGGPVAGPVLAWIFAGLIEHVQHVPTCILPQFVSTFGVWIVAGQVGLSGVLTMVCHAIAVPRSSPCAHAGTDPHTVARRVADGSACHEHSRVHLHRPSDPPDPAKPRGD